jgi:hypothetical protein
MTRLVNNSINSLVQVVDSNGDKVTDAVVNYKVYFYDYDDDEVWEIAESGLMTHIGDGLYQVEWTPEFYGEYVFYAYSTNPKFHESYTYFIEDVGDTLGQFDFNHVTKFYDGYGHNYAMTGVVQDVWQEIQSITYHSMNVYDTEYYEVIGILMFQYNGEGAAKNIEVRITIDDEVIQCSNGSGFSWNSSIWQVIQIGMFKRLVYNPASNADEGDTSLELPILRTAYGGLPIKCNEMKIEARCRSAPGTNQSICVTWAFQKKGKDSTHPEYPS